MIEKKLIEELVSKSIEGTTMFITAMNVKPGNKIMVFIDGDQSVSIEDCVKISRFVESSLDREKEDFELHVSSHGLTSPLTMPRQYVKNIGKEITILMHDGIKISGTIISADETSFVFEKEKNKKTGKAVESAEITKLEYSEIKEVKLKISFK